MKINGFENINVQLSAEALEKITGGETYHEINLASDLKTAIAANQVTGAQYLAIALVQRGMLADLKKVLDSFTNHNEAWNMANTYYLINAK